MNLNRPTTTDLDRARICHNVYCLSPAGTPFFLVLSSPQQPPPWEELSDRETTTRARPVYSLQDNNMRIRPYGQPSPLPIFGKILVIKSTATPAIFKGFSMAQFSRNCKENMNLTIQRTLKYIHMWCTRRGTRMSVDTPTILVGGR